MNFITKLAKRYLRNKGYDIIVSKDSLVLDKHKVTYQNDLLYTYHSCDFMKDPKFLESYELGKNTDGGMLLKDYDIQWRIHVLVWAANYAKNLEGDFADCGVSSGIFARAIINYIDFNSTGKTYYLLDTFQGMHEDYSSEEEMKASSILGYDKEDKFEKVKKTFEPFNTKIIKGPIPETLSLVDSDKFAFISIDMNSVIPEVEALKFFWDRLVPGGIIVLDDHGYSNVTKPQEKAQNDFAKSVGAEVLYLPTCQGIIIKS